MSRVQRSVHADAFADTRDFNEQLYVALKASPWWMVSLGVHIVLYVVSTLTASPPFVAPEKGLDLQVTQTASDPLPELPPEPLDPEIDTPRTVPDAAVAPEPDLRPELEDGPPEVDDDSLHHETNGEEGLSSASLAGPANNAIIGIGASAGSRYGRPGRSGSRNAGRRSGNNPRLDDALDDALRWLAAHQSPDGAWEAAGFDQWYDGKPATGPRPDGLGKAQYDTGVTGLALLAFLGAGYTNRGDHPYAKVVQNGLRWLKSVQDPEGCFGPRSTGHYVYNHAVAALAMVEGYGMTGSAVYKGPAQKALDFIAMSRNPYFAWRYGVKPAENDTSVTGWMMMALKSAKIINAADVKAGRPAPLVIDEDAFDGIRSWVDKMTDPDTGRVGYVQRGTGPARPADLVDRFPAEKSESMTAVGVLARVFLGESPKTDPVRKGAELCASLLPTWNPHDGSIDMYYWYYATLAMFQVGGKPWDAWSAAMKPAMVDSQRRDGDYSTYKGSWDPIDPWGKDGGRVYSTAVMAMCFEVHYRYAKVFGTQVDPR